MTTYYHGSKVKVPDSPNLRPKTNDNDFNQLHLPLFVSLTNEPVHPNHAELSAAERRYCFPDLYETRKPTKEECIELARIVCKDSEVRMDPLLVEKLITNDIKLD